MNIKKLKSRKAISLVDIIIAMSILIMFISVIGSLYYQIILNSNMIRINATAVSYAVKIAEDIDRISYENVTDDLNTNIKERYALHDNFTASVNIKNYNENDDTKQDIIKIVTINIKYNYLDTSGEYTIKKLKIKEY